MSNDQSKMIQDIYKYIFNYVQNATNPEDAEKFSRTSYERIKAYFRNLSVFIPHKNGELETQIQEFSDNEILAFSVWMVQFIEELKGAVIGLGKIDIVQITTELKPQLETVGFYDFFEQARELSYD